MTETGSATPAFLMTYTLPKDGDVTSTMIEAPDADSAAADVKIALGEMWKPSGHWGEKAP